MTLAAALAADPQGRSRHLLVLRGSSPDDVARLARARFPAARWEHPADDGVPGLVLRLSRHTTLAGPFEVGRAESMDLQLPAWGEHAWVVRGPRERGEPPWDVGGDVDGLKRVFAAGMPVRDEGRTVEWLVAVARHLSGAVRFGDPGVVVVPDPLTHVEVTVYSGVWLEPAATLVVARRLLPQSRLATDAHPWVGPPDVDLARLGVEPLDEVERAELHAVADAEDIAVMGGPDELDGYGIEIDLDIDGTLAVAVLVEDAPPRAVVGEPWSAELVVAYRVMWVWEDEDDVAQERPPMQYRVARSRAVPLVRSLATVLSDAAGPALVLTPDEFPVP